MREFKKRERALINTEDRLVVTRGEGVRAKWGKGVNCLVTMEGQRMQMSNYSGVYLKHIEYYVPILRNKFKNNILEAF